MAHGVIRLANTRAVAVVPRRLQTAILDLGPWNYSAPLDLAVAVSIHARTGRPGLIYLPETIVALERGETPEWHPMPDGKPQGWH